MNTRWLQFGPGISLFGVILLAVNWGDPLFRNGEGAFLGSFALPLSVCVALILSGILISKGFYRFAFWFALGLIGQAIGLQLIEAGSSVRYQHYKPIVHFFTDTHPAILVFLATQAILVLGGIRNRWKNIKAWQAKNLRVWQIICLGCIFFIPSATVSHDVFVYFSEIVIAGFLQLINLGNLILIAWNFPAHSFTRLRKRIEDSFTGNGQGNQDKLFWIEPFVLILAVWVLVSPLF